MSSVAALQLSASEIISQEGTKEHILRNVFRSNHTHLKTALTFSNERERRPHVQSPLYVTLSHKSIGKCTTKEGANRSGTAAMQRSWNTKTRQTFSFCNPSVTFSEFLREIVFYRKKKTPQEGPSFGVETLLSIQVQAGKRRTFSENNSNCCLSREMVLKRVNVRVFKDCNVEA